MEIISLFSTNLLFISTIITSLICLIYWKLTNNLNYWTRLGIPGPKPYPLIGTLIYSFLTPIVDIEIKWFQKYGPIYGLFNKTKPMVSVGEPELLKQILVKDFHLFTDRKDRLADHPVISKNLFNSTGEDWRRYRSILSPTFSSGKMRQMFPIIRECLEGFEQALHQRTGSTSSSSTTSRPVTINAKEWTSSFTMDVIASCAFATKIQAYDSTGRSTTITTNQSDNNPFVYHARRLLSSRWWSMVAMAVLPKPILMAIGLKWPVPERHNQFFFDLTRSVIQKRKQQQLDGTGSQKYTDFIQLMMNAEMIDSSSGGGSDGGVGDDDLNDTTEAHHVNDGNEELEIERKILSSAAAANKKQQKRLTETEIQAQGWVFFLAGFETTATTLAYLMYELAMNPAVQDRLYEELVHAFGRIDDGNGANGAAGADNYPTYDQLSKLPYLDAVVSETLRMYPPVTTTDRKLVSNTGYRLGQTGITLTPGQVVSIPIYAIHHCDRFYPNAGQFQPDRWLPEQRHHHLMTPYTYLPFGAGPRNCIGMRFALMEIKLSLAQLVRGFQFSRTPQTAVPLEFRKVVRLCSAKEIMVGIEERH